MSFLINSYVQQLFRAHDTPNPAALNRRLILLAKSKAHYKNWKKRLYWLELLIEGEFVAENKLKPLSIETDGLISIFVTIAIKTKSRNKK